MDSRAQIAVFDLDDAGHHRMYIDMVADAWLEHQSQGRMDIWVASSFLKRYPDFEQSHPSDRVAVRTFVSPLPAALNEGPPSSVLDVKRASAAAIKEIEASNPHQILAMFFDHVQLALAERSWNGPKFSGIVFRSSFHFPARSVKDRLKKWIKKRALLRSADRTHRLLCLDPFAADAINKALGTGKAASLPDGLSELPATTSREELRRDAGLADESHVALVFGSIAARKGVHDICVAAQRLESDVAARTTIAFIGEIPPAEMQAIKASIDACSEAVTVVRESGFVTDERMAQWLTMCDSILVPYHHHTGSSNVMLRAAMAGKPAIVSDFELMGAWAEAHHLGPRVPVGDHAAIASAMTEVIRNESGAVPGFNVEKARAFGKSHAESRFKAAINELVFAS